ncbi:MAG TPA: aminoacyl-tRNA hydrolase [Flavobacteriales bacterium]|nr:aminoacyl-tRNA hydrolase [Flavobacteriales bacterium]HIN39167.1 aminoacyl-tRNA hydrolase [Flavobacteriales bacterium]
MKSLIVGLGNIGKEYEHSRHNIGFDILDALSADMDGSFSLERYGYIHKLRYKSRTIILLKPSTFVNLSGKAVNYWLQKEKIKAENLLVVLDDLALHFGSVRMRKKGNDGGHNGLKSINQLIATQDYPRLRFGIGSEFNKGTQVDFVLGGWTKEEEKALNDRKEMAKKMILSFCTLGSDRTMSDYNNK